MFKQHRDNFTASVQQTVWWRHWSSFMLAVVLILLYTYSVHVVKFA